LARLAGVCEEHGHDEFFHVEVAVLVDVREFPGVGGGGWVRKLSGGDRGRQVGRE
jgi:hypothetical protein